MKTTQKVTRKEAAIIVQRGKTFAEVVAADAAGAKEIKKNDGATTERRPSIRQETTIKLPQHKSQYSKRKPKNPPRKTKSTRKTDLIAG